MVISSYPHILEFWVFVVTHIADSSTYTKKSTTKMDSTSTAIVPLNDRPTDAVQVAMQQLVSDNTKDTYALENIRFIVYLYDRDPDEYIWDQVLDDFHKAHEEDEENQRTKKRPSLRACIRRHLSAIIAHKKTDLLQSTSNELVSEGNEIESSRCMTEQGKCKIDLKRQGP